MVYFIYPTNVSKILLFQHVINLKILMRYFTFSAPVLSLQNPVHIFHSTFQFSLATLQVFNSHVWLWAAMLANAAPGYLWLSQSQIDDSSVLRKAGDCFSGYWKGLPRENEQVGRGWPLTHASLPHQRREGRLLHTTPLSLPCCCLPLRGGTCIGWGGAGGWWDGWRSAWPHTVFYFHELVGGIDDSFSQFWVLISVSRVAGKVPHSSTCLIAL